MCVMAGVEGRGGRLATFKKNRSSEREQLSSLCRRRRRRRRRPAVLLSSLPHFFSPRRAPRAAGARARAGARASRRARTWWCFVLVFWRRSAAKTRSAATRSLVRPCGFWFLQFFFARLVGEGTSRDLVLCIVCSLWRGFVLLVERASPNSFCLCVFRAKAGGRRESPLAADSADGARATRRRRRSSLSPSRRSPLSGAPCPCWSPCRTPRTRRTRPGR